jgi:hypothetical protein
VACSAESEAGGLMTKGVRVDWEALDPKLRKLAESGMPLVDIAKRLQICDRAISARAKRIGLVIQQSRGGQFGAMRRNRDETDDYDGQARRIPTLNELVKLRSLG